MGQQTAHNKDEHDGLAAMHLKPPSGPYFESRHLVGPCKQRKRTHHNAKSKPRTPRIPGDFDADVQDQTRRQRLRADTPHRKHQPVWQGPASATAPSQTFSGFATARLRPGLVAAACRASACRPASHATISLGDPTVNAQHQAKPRSVQATGAFARRAMAARTLAQPVKLLMRTNTRTPAFSRLSVICRL